MVTVIDPVCLKPLAEMPQWKCITGHSCSRASFYSCDSHTDYLTCLTRKKCRLSNEICLQIFLQPLVTEHVKH